MRPAASVPHITAPPGRNLTSVFTWSFNNVNQAFDMSIKPFSKPC